MFGTFRLALACAVVAFHMGVTAGGIYPGIAAVICFLMVSGYAMSGLISATFPGRECAAPFYLDRAARLLPQFWFYAVVSAFNIYVLGWRFGVSQSGPPTIIGILGNFTLLPLGAYMFSPALGHSMLMPQAWTLSLEAVFYLALPWLLLSRWAMWASLIIAATVFTTATHGLIDPDVYGYRLMPAPLLWFLAGVALQRRDWPMFGAIAAFTALTWLWLLMAGKFWLGFNAAVLAGAGIGLALLPLLARLPRHPIDDALGNASYGAYLAHYLFVAPLADHQGNAWAIGAAIVGSVVCGWISWALIERPVAAWRRRIRRQSGRTGDRAESLRAVPARSI